ncbi:MAG: leucine-rich repeat protein, partial [Clostridia bacterium]|nr:leucine-rich repeat protein [Clostridia bacterium]
MKRKIFALICAVGMLISIVIPTFAAEFASGDAAVNFEYDGFLYSLEDGEITITGCISDVPESLVIPETINGYPVTAIGEYAFLSRTGLKSIQMPSVKYIGLSAFESTGLENVVLPKVTHIGSMAFMDCAALTSIDMPELLTLDEGVFARSYALADVSAPKLKEAAGGNFLGTQWLDNISDEYVMLGDGVLVYYQGRSESVVLSDEVKCVAGFRYNTTVESVNTNKATIIADSAFYGCENLRTVEMPHATRIGAFAFNVSSDGFMPSALTDVSMPLVTDVEECAFTWCEDIQNLEMPNVINIGYGAFRYCTSLQSVSMPLVRTIDDMAFYECTALASVEIPAATEMIGAGAFASCVLLTNITVADENTHYAAESGFLYNKDKTKLESYPSAQGEIAVSPLVTEIAAGAFWRNNNITSVSMPGVEVIGEEAFYGCEQISNFTAPNVRRLDENALYSCSKIETLSFPKVAYIGDLALCHCTALAEVDVSQVLFVGESAFDNCDSLTSISFFHAVDFEKYALAYCSQLKGVYFYSDMRNLDGIMFEGCPDDFTLYYARGTECRNYTGYPSQEFDPENCHEVTYIDAYDGREYLTSYIKDGTVLVNLPEPPYHEGAEAFTGWDYDGEPITGDITITALYGTPAPPESEEPTPTPPESEEPTPTPPESEEPTPTPPVSEEPTPTPPESEEPTPTPPVSEEPTPTPPESEEPTPTPPVSAEPTPTPPESEEPTPTPPVSEEPTP